MVYGMYTSPHLELLTWKGKVSIYFLVINGKKTVLNFRSLVHHTKPFTQSLHIVLTCIEPLRISASLLNQFKNNDTWPYFITTWLILLRNYKLLSQAIFVGSPLFLAYQKLCTVIAKKIRWLQVWSCLQSWCITIWIFLRSATFQTYYPE